MHALKGNNSVKIVSPSEKGVTLKGKRCNHLEQLFSFKSGIFFQVGEEEGGGVGGGAGGWGGGGTWCTVVETRLALQEVRYCFPCILTKTRLFNIYFTTKN